MAANCERPSCSSSAAVLSRNTWRMELVVPPTLMAMPAPPVTKARPILTPVSPTALALATR